MTPDIIQWSFLSDKSLWCVANWEINYEDPIPLPNIFYTPRLDGP
jgi:hypothetical protein